MTNADYEPFKIPELTPEQLDELRDAWNRMLASLVHVQVVLSGHLQSCSCPECARVMLEERYTGNWLN